MQLNHHCYSRKEINEAKELSFGIVRNLIGVVALWVFLVLSTLFSVFNIRGGNQVIIGSGYFILAL
jgi:hypothetical protein